MEPYLILLVGLILIIRAVAKSDRPTLKATGKKVEGVIFDFNGQRNTLDNSTITIDDPDCARVRFVTEKLEWITEDISKSSGLRFRQNYSTGDKVTVYYDPDKPTNFYIDSGLSEPLTRVLTAILGFGIVLVGIYKLLTN